MHKSDVPACHACSAPPLYQWSRLATAAEAASQKADIFRLQGRVLSDEDIAQRYGPLRVAVSGCADHHLGDDPQDPDSGMKLRALLHNADCEGHSACGCREAP